MYSFKFKTDFVTYLSDYKIKHLDFGLKKQFSANTNIARHLRRSNQMGDGVRKKKPNKVIMW